jgi:SSS family solute:Na+ symporter
VGFVAVLVNLLVAVIVTLILRATKTPAGIDGTAPDDYFADEGDPRLEKARTTTETLASST